MDGEDDNSCVDWHETPPIVHPKYTFVVKDSEDVVDTCV